MVMVTVNPSCRAHELAYILRQSRARGIFHQSRYRDVSMREVIDEACSKENLVLDVRVCLDDLHEFAASDRSDEILPSVPVDSPVMIQYTSGTTGAPKGVLLSHHAVTNTARIMAQIKGLNELTINLAPAPLFHTGGCVGGVLSSVQTYGALLLPERFDADTQLDLIEQECVSYTFAVPTMLIALLEAQRERPRDMSTLRTVFSGGSVVPVEVVKRVESEFEASLIIGYGLTESSPAITHTRFDDSAQDKSETIGRPIPQVEVKIVDPETGAIQPVGEPGELCCRGFNVMLGYYDMPEVTAETIDSVGWLHTGDLCTMDSRGYCRVTGRLKDMIIRGGENVYPREIEEVLYTHPDISEVAVIGVPDEYWGEQVAGVITLKKSTTLTGADLHEFACLHLARYKVPKFWYVVDEMPMTASGKLQKYRLKETLSRGELEHCRI
jgi:fatty-acyl-CoA synthase